MPTASGRRPYSACLGLCLLAACTQSVASTLSEQLLQTYFATAGVCTTSEVTEIRDTGSTVEINIRAEEQTKKALARLPERDLDNWFSLHCPPEIHGVWQQENPPEDIQVLGLIGNDQPYTLSCAQFQQKQIAQPELTLKYRIQKWIEERLN